MLNNRNFNCIFFRGSLHDKISSRSAGMKTHLVVVNKSMNCDYMDKAGLSSPGLKILHWQTLAGMRFQAGLKVYSKMQTFEYFQHAEKNCSPWAKNFHVIATIFQPGPALYKELY